MILKFIMINKPHNRIEEYYLEEFENNLMYSIGYGGDVRSGRETTGTFTCCLTMGDNCANVVVF